MRESLPKPKAVEPHGRPERIVVLLGTITPESIPPIMHKVLSYDADGRDPIVLQITSPGGCVSSGLALIDVIAHVRAPVFTIGIGMVASMGAIILACGHPGHRYTLPHTRIMLHGVSGNSFGKLDEVQSAMRLHRSLEAEVEELLLERLTINRIQLRRLLRQERFLSAREATQMGVIDHIL